MKTAKEFWMDLCHAIPFMAGRALRIFRHQVPDLNFITLHYLYFICTALLAAVVFWGSSTPPRSFGFTDCLFLTVSAMTEAGLNTVNLSTLNTFQQIILFLLILAGSTIFVSISVVHIRRSAFENRIHFVLRKNRKTKSRIWKSLSKSRINQDLDTLKASGQDRNLESNSENLNHLNFSGVWKSENQPSRQDESDENKPITPINPTHQELPKRNVQVEPQLSPVRPDHISFSTDSQFREASREGRGRNHRHRILSFSGVGARPDVSLPRMFMRTGRSNSIISAHSHRTVLPLEQDLGECRFNTDEASSEKDPAFIGPSYAERRRLGGAEYKAVVFLSWVVPLYFVAWQLLGTLAMGAYMNRYHASIALENGLNPW